jgi:hypothetical protein
MNAKDSYQASIDAQVGKTIQKIHEATLEGKTFVVRSGKLLPEVVEHFRDGGYTVTEKESVTEFSWNK